MDALYSEIVERFVDFSLLKEITIRKDDMERNSLDWVVSIWNIKMPYEREMDYVSIGVGGTCCQYSLEWAEPIIVVNHG